MRTLAAGGDPVKSLNGVSASGAGEIFAVAQPPGVHGGGPREVTWSYDEGATPPTSYQMDLEGDFDAAFGNATSLGSVNTLGSKRTTSVIGKFPFLRLNMVALVIGPGDPIDGRISL